MPVIAADFVLRLSGGASNAVGNNSLGGAKSSELMPTSIDGLFDFASAAEALAGRVEYRCVYLHNASASQMLSVRVWIQSNTPLAGTTTDIGVGTSAVNGVEQTIAGETIAPAGVTFSTPASAAAGLALSDIPPGQHRALWFRRTTSAGALYSPDDPTTLGFDCEFTS